jgi:hypothetical protein
VNDRQDFDRAVARWFDDGSDTTPPRVINAVLLAARNTPQEREVRIPWVAPVTLPIASAAAAIAVVIVGVAALSGLGPRFGVGSLPTLPGSVQTTPEASPERVSGSLPADQRAVVARHVAAVNSRDADAFVHVFAAEGGFDPRGTFASASLFANTLPVADRSLVEIFVAMQDTWGFEVEVVACDELSYADYADRYMVASEDVEVFAQCAVKSRWFGLSLEIDEWWNYEFSGTDVLWWGQTVRDATPADRELALSLVGLLQWETWLETTDPQAAARLLNPRVYPITVPCGDGPAFANESHTELASPEPSCEWSSQGVDAERIASDDYGRGLHDWTVAGRTFHPRALIPYDPALAPEIDASIQEYLAQVER